MSRIFRVLPLIACAAAVCGLLVSLAGSVWPPSPIVALTPAHEARLARKNAAIAAGRAVPFDAPDAATEFYVNKRTGPLYTRGPAVTRGARALSPALYLPAIAQMRAMPRYSSADGRVLSSLDADPTSALPGAALGTWAPLGPSNQGGRTRAFLIHPTQPNIMYAGGVAGGVWRTTDGGSNWTPLSDLTIANLAVVSLAFLPGDPNTIYAGTGEGFFNLDAIRGAGIFRSTDAGATWTQLASTNVSNFHYVNSLVISPRNPQRMFAATRTGVFRSTNGGASWTQLVTATSNNGCTQVTMQRTAPTAWVFAACGNFTQGGIHRGTDDDTSAMTQVFSPSLMARSSLAIAPSNEAIIYVLSARYGFSGLGEDSVLAVYRSSANGDPGTFTTQVNGDTATTIQQRLNRVQLTNPLYAFLNDCGLGTTQNFNQGWYDNVIAVDPVDPERVWAGGIDLMRSDDGGVNWGIASYWWKTRGVDPQYSHADQHAIVFHPQYDGVSNRVMYAMSDGGVTRTDNARAAVGTTLQAVCGTPVAGATTWVDRNNGYTTTQFYDGTVYPDGATYFGGMQDNGTQRGGLASSAWTQILGGDGGYTAVDTRNDAVSTNDVLFAAFTGLSIRKSTNGGATFASAVSGISNSGFLFIAPVIMNQGAKDQLWTGGSRLWRTVNQAVSWQGASTTVPGNGSISAIAAHPLDGNRVIAGTSDGYILASSAALSTTTASVWTNSRPTTSYVSSLTWDPTDINVAYATVSAFGITNLWRSTDGGVTWQARAGGGATALPRIPALSVVVHPDFPQQVYVGTDLGVFTSVDAGANWYVENTGFANVPVETLKINETAPRRVYAFTHGRGAWIVTPADSGTTTPTAISDAYSTPANTPLSVGAPGVLGNDLANGGGALTAILQTAPTTGTLVLDLNGGFTYTPPAGFSGTASFTYRATNGGGSSNVATVTISVLPVVGPQAPAGFRVAGMSGNTVTFAWTLPAAGPAPTAIQLEGGLTPGAVIGAIPLGVSTSATLSLPTGSFYLRLRSITPSGTSGPSNEIVAHVAAPVAPAAPATLLGTAAGSNLVLAWTPTFTGGAPTSALLEVSGAVTAALPLGNVDRFQFSGVPPGTYTFAVRQSNASGTSARSNAITLTFPGSCGAAPGVPRNFVASAAGSTLTLFWDPPASGGAPTSYLLTVGGAYVGVLPFETRSLTTPVPAGTYRFTVAATNPCGTGPATSQQSITIP